MGSHNSYPRWSLARIPDRNADTLAEMFADGWVRFATTPTDRDDLGADFNWLRQTRTEALVGPIMDALMLDLENGWEPVDATPMAGQYGMYRIRLQRAGEELEHQLLIPGQWTGAQGDQ